jgi:hypothetical protein
MYLITYIINDDLKILRFSTNRFVNHSKYIRNDDIVVEFINYLKEQGIEDQDCYNMIHPWKDLLSPFIPNSEYIIVYNITTNHIQGWCNLVYSKINNGSKSLYTCFIRDIVVRSKPKIPQIGTIILEFIRNECFKNFITFIDIDKEKKIKTDLLYLYAITTSINFYKKTYFTSLDKHLSDDTNNELYKHVFIYLQDITKTTKYKQFKDSLDMLHDFEVNSIMNDNDINIYSSFKAPDNCNHPKTIDYKFIDILFSNSKILSNSITSSSKRRRITKKY